MFEHKNQRLLSRRKFISRLVLHTIVAAGVLLFSLAGGILGYSYFEKMGLVDALLNASMILGGMGPVDVLHSEGGKIFASVYAIYSGVVFLVVASLIIGPLLHRLMHHFHVEIEK